MHQINQSGEHAKKSVHTYQGILCTFLDVSQYQAGSHASTSVNTCKVWMHQYKSIKFRSSFVGIRPFQLGVHTSRSVNTYSLMSIYTNQVSMRRIHQPVRCPSIKISQHQSVAFASRSKHSYQACIRQYRSIHSVQCACTKILQYLHGRQACFKSIDT